MAALSSGLNAKETFKMQGIESRILSSMSGSMHHRYERDHSQQSSLISNFYL
jgi:hypothetical protein